MLDIKFLADNVDYVRARLGERSGSYDIGAVLCLNERRREILKDVESKKATRNAVSEKIAALKRAKENADGLIADMKALGDGIKVLDDELADLELKLRDGLLGIPNLPHDSVPKGHDESCNTEIRRHGTPNTFDFEPKPHWEIGEKMGILDFASAGKITGARFTVYKGDGARLERALINFMLDTHAKSGYEEVFPPFMVNRDSMYGTGQLPKFEEDAFSVKGTNYFMVPTAEVPVTNLLRGETIDEALLPIKYCAYTACFRAEAGSAGRDTRGLIRQHQFNKVELVKFTRPEDSFKELEALTLNAEDVLKLLGLPYRVVALCTGDLGFSSAKTYDLEVWMPSYGRYVEISSCSNFLDYQARRMNIKYRAGKATGFVHTLNGSGVAIGRTTAAILENFQNADGTVGVPQVLRPYFGKDKIGNNREQANNGEIGK